jgi:RimJ/RimL family protein N-acetyltransferase
LAGVRQDERTIPFAIRALEDDRLLGTLELDEILWAHRVCGVAVAIGERENWGRGFGSEAVALGLGFAFRELNLHRVTATVFAYNDRSIALLEKVGFQREGTYREFLERDGERHDMFLYGILRPEWMARSEDR